MTFHDQDDFSGFCRFFQVRGHPVSGAEKRPKGYWNNHSLVFFYIRAAAEKHDYYILGVWYVNLG